MATQQEELEASVRELEATLADAPPEMRPIVQQQIEALRSAMGSLARVAPAIEQQRRARPELPEELAWMKLPERPLSMPAWVPDDVHITAVTDEMMRCPAGAAIYRGDGFVSCAVPQGPGAIPVKQGLSLLFHASTGRLESQRFYRDDLLLWSISYHATGGRAHEGFYTATERLSYPEHGLHTHYAPGGTIVRQAHYHHGALHGWSRLWEDDGYPISATRHEQGRVIETVLPDGTRRSG